MKKITYLSILVCFLLASCTTSAQTGKYTSKNKKAIKSFESALSSYRNSQYESRSKNLSAAISSLDKAIDKDPNFVDAYMMRSKILAETGKLKEAIKDKEKGLQIMPEYSKVEYFYLAEMQMKAAQYQDGAKNAAKFLTYRNNNPTFEALAKKYIKNAEFAQDAMKNPVKFEPKNLGANINTTADEYHPSIMGDENTIIFTRVIKDPRIQNRRGAHEDLYTSNRETDGEWKVSTSISKKINTLLNEGSSSISADGNYLIFTNCAGADGTYGDTRRGKGSCDLFYTKKIGKRWATPRNMGIPVNSVHWESQPSFSADGRSMYFIQRRSRQADINKQDIYETHVGDDGYWTKPKKLSSVINTPEAEQTVFIHPDGQTLYFASNGHTGMGGLDLFLSRKQPNGEWGTPVNLGYPINTEKNEDGIIVSANGERAYFASTRDGGFGGSDIYYFDLPEESRPVLTTYMKGKVFDAESKTPLGAIFELVDVETGELIIQSESNDMTGDFLVNIPTNKKLALNVSKDGYFFYSKNYTFEEKENKNDPFLVDVPLEKIKVSDKGFVLENVFFDVNKYDLKPESKVELNKLYDFLLLNKTLKVELGGHTDSDGEDTKNQVLSENRAKAVVTYLIEKGINKDRLTYKGYGETVPVAPNDTKENKAKNRRTEVKIIGK